MSLLENLNWRFAAKQFDASRKLSAEQISQLKEMIRLTPTSFGLQPYHFILIENNEANTAKLAAIQAAAWNQPQITSCSHLLALCARKDLPVVKEEFFSLISGGNAEARAALATYEGMVDNFLPNASADWAKKQVYIALGFAMAAAADLQIDSCPMEGFDATAVSAILELPDTLDLTLLLPLGFRPADDVSRPKTRFATEQLFSNL
jgi:nitroreductase